MDAPDLERGPRERDKRIGQALDLMARGVLDLRTRETTLLQRGADQQGPVLLGRQLSLVP